MTKQLAEAEARAERMQEAALVERLQAAAAAAAAAEVPRCLVFLPAEAL